jgi:hypothetical protein
MNIPRTEPDPPLRPYHLLAAVPVVGMLGGIPFANRTEPYVLGLPFLLAWIVGWIVLTSAILGVIYRLDEAAARRMRDAAATDAAEGAR